jgi:uncharacterized protein (DUF427 family)
MSLTMGTGPFGHAPAGVFNTEVPRDGLLYFEPSPRRLRGMFAGETVVDSRRVRIMHERGHLPRAYFPRADVRTELLLPTDHRTHAPGKGEAVYWSLRVGDRVAENAAWSYPDPPAGAPPLGEYLALFVRALDAWLEEDEPMLGHVRDPYHRVDVVNTSRQVRVALGRTVLADSGRTRVIFETGLPPRWYFPSADVTAELVPSELRTVCAYKGEAEYHSVRLGDELYENLAWTYTRPRHDAAGVAGYVAFFNERVDVTVDGEPDTHQRTPWSEPGWWKRAPEFAAQI